MTVKAITFGSVQATPLTLGTSGSLTTLGNISGVWTNGATHQIVVGSQILAVGGDMVLSDGTNGHAINLDIGSGTVTVTGPLTQSGGANLTFSGAGTLNLADDFNYSGGGAFTAGSGLVNYKGSAAQIVAGGIGYGRDFPPKQSSAANPEPDTRVRRPGPPQ